VPEVFLSGTNRTHPRDSLSVPFREGTIATGSGDDVSLAFPTGTIDGAEWNAGPEETTTADEGADRPPDRAAAVW
jgi:hypothetical protein